MAAAARYIAEVRGSQEVSLVGRADFDYWAERLRAESLVPVRVAGNAELLISAVASRWKGLRFGEFSVSVRASRTAAGNSRDGHFLVAAYNSSRLLTFFERNVFRTPYRCATIDVRAAERPSMSLFDGDALSVFAEMAGAVPTQRTGDDGYEGAIFLPSRPPGTQFFARLAGFTEVYPFVPDADVVKLTPSAAHPVVRQLLDSHFAGREWHIRRQATHARSKTYSRD